MSINSVSGTIYNAFDAPMAAVTVTAYDKDLRTEQLVGFATTDAPPSQLHFPLLVRKKYGSIQEQRDNNYRLSNFYSINRRSGIIIFQKKKVSGYFQNG